MTAPIGRRGEQEAHRTINVHTAVFGESLPHQNGAPLTYDEFSFFLCIRNGLERVGGRAGERLESPGPLNRLSAQPRRGT